MLARQRGKGAKVVFESCVNVHGSERERACQHECERASLSVRASLRLRALGLWGCDCMGGVRTCGV